MTSSRKDSMVMPIAMFALATSFYLYEFLLRVSPNVLHDDLLRAFNIDVQAFGFFSSCFFWSYAPLQLPVGALTDKMGPRRLLTGAILLCALSSLALAYTQSFYVACLARLFIGAGSAFAFISCMKIVNIWFEPRWFPFMTGLTLAIGTLGAAGGTTPISIALDYITWRELLINIGYVGVGLAVLAWFLIRDHNPHHSDASQKANDNPGFWRCVCVVAKQPQSWIVGIYAFFITAPTDAFGGAWANKFLEDAHGISRDTASIAVMMIFVGMAVGSPLLGWISGKMNNRKKPMMISSFVACAALTLIVYLPTLSVWGASTLFFIFGAAGTYVLAFVMTRRFTESKYVATAVGFVNMISVFGSAILTYFIGWLLNFVWSGEMNAAGERLYSISDYHISLIVLPIFYAISAIVIVPFVRDEKD